MISLLTLADGIKFKDMDALHLMKRLAMVERNPQVIWKAVN
jgi:hypothetical protein